VVRLVKSASASTAAAFLVIFGLSSAAVAAGTMLFGLTVAGAIALYFVVWWTGLFAVLPFGVRSQAEMGEVAHGSDPGAPTTPALAEKAIWTTIVAAVVFVAAAWLLPLAGL
jgi:predicted secreted protein